MGVTALNITPDIFIKPSTDAISSLESHQKKQQLSLQEKELLDNIHDGQPNKEEIAKAIAEVNKTLAPHNTRLEFSIHEKTKEIMVKVLDEKTGEIIREVPPKRVLDMVAMAWEELGLLVDEKA